MVHVGLDRLPMQLISATCEDGVIRQYQPAHIRVRIEEVRGSIPRSSTTFVQVSGSLDAQGAGAPGFTRPPSAGLVGVDRCGDNKSTALVFISTRRNRSF